LALDVEIQRRDITHASVAYFSKEKGLTFAGGGARDLRPPHKLFRLEGSLKGGGGVAVDINRKVVVIYVIVD
jgi:hypothetical protein